MNLYKYKLTMQTVFLSGVSAFMTVQKCTSIIYLRLLTEKKASTGDGARCAMRYYAVIGGPCVKIGEMFP